MDELAKYEGNSQFDPAGLDRIKRKNWVLPTCTKFDRVYRKPIHTVFL